MENGYNLWTSHGRQLDHKRYDKLHQLLWRPRPPSLLSEAKEKEIRKNLRDYSRKYEAEVMAAPRRASPCRAHPSMASSDLALIDPPTLLREASLLEHAADL